MARPTKLAISKEYSDFVKKVGYGQLNNVETTHDGYPLSTKEAKFISEFIKTGNVPKSLKYAKLTHRDIAGKDYIADEVTYQLEELKKASIATADEVMQYLTKVMRGEENDQFGLDAPLSERTSAAKELAKRLMDMDNSSSDSNSNEVKITLNWEGLMQQ